MTSEDAMRQVDREVFKATAQWARDRAGEGDWCSQCGARAKSTLAAGDRFVFDVAHEAGCPVSLEVEAGPAAVEHVFVEENGRMFTEADYPYSPPPPAA